jgi:hypothetical protein
MSWFAYQINWIKQRREALDSGRVWELYYSPIDHGPHRRVPPWPLMYFGGKTPYAAGLLVSRSASDEELEWARKLFPEHTVERGTTP